MKRFFAYISAFTTVFSLFSIASTAMRSPDFAQNWYVKRNSVHAQPSLDDNMKYIEDHSAYYVDRACKENDKKIYLTFDAGYENGNIEKILDVLKKHGAKGAFFVLENLIKKNTELVKSMKNEGHLVCNHTSKHPDMTSKTTFEEFKKELESLENVYKEYTGNELDRFFRPPEGRFNERTLVFAEKAGYKTVFWSCAYADWDNNRQKSPEYAKELLKKNTHPGMILLLHPTSATNAEILDEMLTYWENEGYSFASLCDLK